MNEEKDLRMENFVMRVRHEAERTLANNRQNGCAIITVHVLMNADGSPLAWVVNDGKRIEPSKDALAVISQFAEGF